MYTKTITADGTIYTDGIATLELHTTGLILNIEVSKNNRGEGRARAIYDFAAAETTVYHVPAWGRTFEGEQFANAVGGETMDDETAAAIVGMDLSIFDLA